MHRCLLFFLLLLTAAGAIAQDSAAYTHSLLVAVHHGFLIAHRPMVQPLQKNKTNAIELMLEQQTTGNKEWHHIYGFPKIGLSAALWELGNPEKLGKSVTLMPFVNFPLTRGRWMDFDFKFGWGLGYIEKKFDVEYNYKNVAIGTHLNSSLIAQPQLRFYLGNRVSLTTGIALTHYSNGSTATPNLGLNFASATAAIAWRFHDRMAIPERQLPEFKRSRRFTIFASAASKQIYPVNGPTYLAASLSVGYTWQISYKSAFGTGTDLFYDHSLYYKIRDQNLPLNSSLEVFRGGFHGGYELTISKLTLLLNMGVYLYSKINDGPFYHRIGLRYRINRNIFVCSNIKAHWGKADFIEWGLGWRFDHKKK